jgi:hypothetical protein
MLPATTVVASKSSRMVSAGVWMLFLLTSHRYGAAAILGLGATAAWVAWPTVARWFRRRGKPPLHFPAATPIEEGFVSYPTLAPSETLLEGKWNFANGKAFADETTLRIHYLAGNVLTRIANDYKGWRVLFRDPADGRYWELSYPEGHMQSGGPRCLTLVDEDFLHGNIAETWANLA